MSHVGRLRSVEDMDIALLLMLIIPGVLGSVMVSANASRLNAAYRARRDARLAARVAATSAS